LLSFLLSHAALRSHHDALLEKHEAHVAQHAESAAEMDRLRDELAASVAGASESVRRVETLEKVRSSFLLLRSSFLLFPHLLPFCSYYILLFAFRLSSRRREGGGGQLGAHGGDGECSFLYRYILRQSCSQF
jgi:hypothetical protein